MFKTILTKSVASVAAAGAVLAVAGLSAPATVTAAPTFRNVACNNYPDKIATTTNITLDQAVQQYGQKNSATVTVSSGTGTPTGSVEVSISGTGFSRTVTLRNGSATVDLPRRLDSGETYQVTAVFTPDCQTGQYAGSSDTAYLTVKKGRSDVHRQSADNIARRGTARPSAMVTSDYMSPGGDARVTITHGKRERSKVVDVEKLDGNDSKIASVFKRVGAARHLARHHRVPRLQELQGLLGEHLVRGEARSLRLRG